jgi:hypothetical protein
MGPEQIKIKLFYSTFADMGKCHPLIYERCFHLSEAHSLLNMLHAYSIAYKLKQKKKFCVFIAVISNCSFVMAGSVSLQFPSMLFTCSTPCVCLL